MNKVVKKLFETYFAPVALTAVALIFCLAHNIRQIHSDLFISGCAAGLLFFLITAFRCMPNDDEFYGRVPHRKETKIFNSILLSLIIVMPGTLYVAYLFPAPMSRVFPMMNEIMLPWLKPIVDFVGQFPIIFPVAIVAVIVAVSLVVFFYRGYDKK